MTPGKRIFVHLAYIDDSGSDNNNHIVVVGAVVIPDTLFVNVEAMAGMVVQELVPLDKLDEFKEFKAVDMYHGNGVFKGIPEPRRHDAMKKLLYVVNADKLKVIYSAVYKRNITETAYGSVNPIDLAFRMCALGIENWVRTNANDSLCLCIMDDTADERLKYTLSSGFRALRGRLWPPYTGSLRLMHVHDDMYFGDSVFSVGIQVADVCNYFLLQKLKHNRTTDD